ncbi:MAG TPA: hypothetical protein VKV18_03775 [Chthonomonas sp.]|uniref:hypothetical protein n=1 Tax=Chthonomonas sp. TaxID=2282153 RepID=UPI002B4B0FDD|nr:hypothetical protein [Chthonomonas sp.]HLI47796.1 hypothetical protein [Chthonomonas sp.]
MKALRSLLSYQHAEWLWQKEGNGYRLLPTADAIALPQRFQEEMDADFLARLHEGAILAAMTPEERLRHLKEVMYVCGIDDPLFCQIHHIDAKKRAEMEAKDVYWGWFRLVDSGLSLAEKQQLLAGVPIMLSFNQLPADVQQSMLELWHRMPNGPSSPTWVQLQLSNDVPQNDPNMAWGIEKSLWLTIQNVGTVGATGFWEENIWRWYKRWLLPEDTPSDPQELQPLPNGFPYQPQVTPLPPNPDPKTLAKLKPITNCTLLDRMQEIAAKLHIPLLATLPHDPEQIYGPLTLNPPKTLADYLQGFSSYPEKWLYHKWNSGLLLVSYPRWPLDQAASLPEYLLQLLRKNLQQQQGLFTLSLLRQLFAQMTPFQQHAFAQRFISQADPQGHFPVFLFMLAHPELESASGMPLTPALTLEVENLHLPAYSAWHKEVFVALKVSVFDRDIGGRLMREFRLVGETTDQRWVPLEGILTGAVPASFWQPEEPPQK